jgi:hypothetical protein
MELYLQYLIGLHDAVFKIMQSDYVFSLNWKRKEVWNTAYFTKKFCVRLQINLLLTLESLEVIIYPSYLKSL